MIYSYQFSIQPHDVDFSKHLSPHILGAYLLDVAGRAANESGFGMQYMNDAGVAWVLSRFSVEIYSLPKEYENITINTWVRSSNKIFTKRLFTVEDEDGNVIIEADSLWSVININTRHVEDLSQLAELTKFIEDKDIRMTPSIKVPKENEIENMCFAHKVKYSDIDMNFHVNSIRYLQWALDTYPLDLYEEKTLLRYDVNYIKEVVFDEKVDIVRSKKDNVYLFCINNNDKNTCCRIKFTWQ